MREAEVEDGSLGTLTSADFGFTVRDFTFDMWIYCLRSVDRIPGLPSGAVKKDEYSIEVAPETSVSKSFVILDGRISRQKLFSPVVRVSGSSDERRAARTNLWAWTPSA